jgi:hypothetical protein
MFVALSLTDLSMTQVSLLCCDLSIFHIDCFVPFFQKRNSSHLLSSFIWSLKYRWTGGLGEDLGAYTLSCFCVTLLIQELLGLLIH